MLRPTAKPISISEQAVAKLEQLSGQNGHYGDAISAPGRVNLIGEHIDYHDLPVLPIAIQKQISIAFTPRNDSQITAVSTQFSRSTSFDLSSQIVPGPRGDWSNYLRAALAAIQTHKPLTAGVDASIASDLPLAAGLSSSSALLVGFSLALLRANKINVDLKDLTALLPEGEQFVGTRGGAMDHVAILASRKGYATLIECFHPLRVRYVRIPGHWRFLVAHSMVTAEKSGALRAQYNERRFAGERALQSLGYKSYREALASSDDSEVDHLTHPLERAAFMHVLSEARRVQLAVAALEKNDLLAFGRLLNESHASLRDQLRVSVPEVDSLTGTALSAGAYGARITGAGFGGCVVALCTADNVERVRQCLATTYYAGKPGFDPEQHLFVAEPSNGALTPEPLDNADQHCSADDGNS